MTRIVASAVFSISAASALELPEVISISNEEAEPSKRLLPDVENAWHVMHHFLACRSKVETGEASEAELVHCRNLLQSISQGGTSDDEMCKTLFADAPKTQCRGDCTRAFKTNSQRAMAGLPVLEAPSFILGLSSSNLHAIIEKTSGGTQSSEERAYLSQWFQPRVLMQGAFALSCPRDLTSWVDADLGGVKEFSGASLPEPIPIDFQVRDQSARLLPDYSDPWMVMTHALHCREMVEKADVDPVYKAQISLGDIHLNHCKMHLDAQLTYMKSHPDERMDKETCEIFFSDVLEPRGSPMKQIQAKGGGIYIFRDYENSGTSPLKQLKAKGGGIYIFRDYENNGTSPLKQLKAKGGGIYIFRDYEKNGTSPVKQIKAKGGGIYIFRDYEKNETSPQKDGLPVGDTVSFIDGLTAWNFGDLIQKEQAGTLSAHEAKWMGGWFEEPVLKRSVLALSCPRRFVQIVV